MYMQLVGLCGEPPRRIDLYIRRAETEDLDESNISKKHLRVLAALHSISMNENDGRIAFADVEYIQSLIAHLTQKLHSAGDIRSFAEDLCIRGYAQKEQHPEHGTIFGIEEKGYDLLSLCAQETQNLPIGSNSPNVAIAFN